MKDIKINDRVVSIRDGKTGVVIYVRWRGVAGCNVTYVDWIEVAYDDGTTGNAHPRYFKKVCTPE